MGKRAPRLIIDLEIVGVNARGHGIGFICNGQEGVEDKEVTVPFTVPGDKVKVAITRRRQKKWCGIILEIIKEGPSRQKPLCPHFTICGGCSLQQMRYSEQLKLKETFVRSCFKDFIANGTEFRPIVSSKEEWLYRNKMEYTFSTDAAGERYLGLIIHGSKRHVLNVEACYLVSSWYLDALRAVRAWWASTSLEAYHPYKNLGTLRNLVVREGKSSGDRMVMLTVSGNPDFAMTSAQISTFVTALREAIEPTDGQAMLSIFLRIQQCLPGVTTNFYEMLLYGPDYIREELLVEPRAGEKPRLLRFHCSPTAFFQPHPRQGATIYSLALQLADIKESDTVYDLYCGIGTISVCAGLLAKKVIGVDISPATALDARLNARLNSTPNVVIYAGAVRYVLEKIRSEGQHVSPDVVFADPPRSGLDPSGLGLILDEKPSRFVYLSCNPLSQVNNIQTLVSHGYRLVTLQPVDQFPQVAHVENIALLVRE